MVVTLSSQKSGTASGSAAQPGAYTHTHTRVPAAHKHTLACVSAPPEVLAWVPRPELKSVGLARYFPEDTEKTGMKTAPAVTWSFGVNLSCEMGGGEVQGQGVLGWVR